MLTEIRLQNVRLFDGEVHSFELAPLTVFTGTNSSGKSTVLKILPLLRQTQGIGEAGAPQDGRLRLRGGQVDLGTYDSLVSNNETSKAIGIGLTFEGALPVGHLEWVRAATAGKLEGFKIESFSQNVSAPYRLTSFFKFNAAAGSGTGTASAGALAEARFEMFGSDPRSILYWRLSRIADEDLASRSFLFRLSLPSPFWEGSQMKQFVKALGGSHLGEVDHIAGVTGILPAVLIAEGVGDEKRSANPEAADGRPWDRWPLPFPIEGALFDLKASLQRVHYLGPLRSPGKRLYLADFDVSPGYDSTGEFLPFILRDKINETVINWHNQADSEVHETLAEAVNYWLMYLRAGNVDGKSATQGELDLSTRDVLLELRLQSPGGPGKYSLADSGFGYSQIIPVIARGLLVEANGTLIVEQPELHLHPALQVRLASFLLAMVRCGKRVIVESHSEHLVNAIRVLIAEDHDDSLAKLCKIYFLQTDDDGLSIHQLSVNRNGTFTDFPRSFFGDALELGGRLLRAQKRFLEL